MVPIGILWLIVAAVSLAPALVLMVRGQSANAVFVGAVERPRGNHGGEFLCPQFRYQPISGPARVVTSTGCSTDQPYADGAAVRIWYDPAHPEQIVVPTFWGLWAGPLFAALLGAFLIILPLFIAIILRRSRRTN